MLTKRYSRTKPICKVTFTLPLEAAAEADEIRLLGDFNDWSWEKGTVMKRRGDAYTATLELATDRRYEFRYLVDGKAWLNDWEADAYLPSPYLHIDNSVVEVGPSKAKKARKVSVESKAKAAASPADDLRRIEGIGPKIAGLLQARGIATFAELSETKLAVLREILAEAGPRYRMHEPKTWPKQAKLAAKGHWEKLAKLQQRLKGGK